EKSRHYNWFVSTSSHLTLPKSEGPVSRPLLMFLLSRHLRPGRCGWRRRCRLWSSTAELGQHTSARSRNRRSARRSARGTIEDRPRLAVEARQDRQEQAGRKEQRRQNAGGARQHVG